MTDRNERNALKEVRDVLAHAPIDCLGEGRTADGQPYPIRDEVIDCITKALAAPAEGGQGEAVELTKCCGREECGGECGNEWRGTEWVRKAAPPAASVDVEGRK